MFLFGTPRLACACQLSTASTCNQDFLDWALVKVPISFMRNRCSRIQKLCHFAHFKGWIVNVFKELNVMKGMGAAGCRAI
jgi:hypothetical protein